MAQRHTIVTTGEEDNFFGIGTATHISVTPKGTQGLWWVLVAEDSRVASASPCLRTDKQFQLLHRALEDAQVGFSQPLPHLPLHSNLLVQSDEEDALRLASQLQEYVAALHVHPEASTLAVYLDFVLSKTDGVQELESEASSGHAKPVVVHSRSFGNLAAGEEALVNACTRVKLSWSDENGDHEVELPVLTPAHTMGKRGARSCRFPAAELGRLLDVVTPPIACWLCTRPQ